jgi:hypothetical protein
MITKKSFCTYALTALIATGLVQTSRATETETIPRFISWFENAYPTNLSHKARLTILCTGGFTLACLIRLWTRSTDESLYTKTWSELGTAIKSDFKLAINHIKNGNIVEGTRLLVWLPLHRFIGNEFKLIDFEQEYPDGLLIKDKKVKAKPCGFIGNFDAYILKNLTKLTEYTGLLALVGFVAYNYLLHGESKAPGKDAKLDPELVTLLVPIMLVLKEANDLLKKPKDNIVPSSTPVVTTPATSQ